jgi:hypothetical protein
MTALPYIQCHWIAVTVSTLKDITANGGVYENRHYLWDTLLKTVDAEISLSHCNICEEDEAHSVLFYYGSTAFCWALVTFSLS